MPAARSGLVMVSFLIGCAVTWHPPVRPSSSRCPVPGRSPAASAAAPAAPGPRRPAERGRRRSRATGPAGSIPVTRSTPRPCSGATPPQPERSSCWPFRASTCCSRAVGGRERGCLRHRRPVVVRVVPRCRWVDLERDQRLDCIGNLPGRPLSVVLVDSAALASSVKSSQPSALASSLIAFRRDLGSLPVFFR
jgi:hypothetical protein